MKFQTRARDVLKLFRMKFKKSFRKKFQSVAHECKNVGLKLKNVRMTLQKLPRKLKTLPHEIPNTFELKFETLSQERLKRSHEIRKSI